MSTEALPHVPPPVETAAPPQAHMRSRRIGFLGGVGILFLLVVLAHIAVVRPWYLRWGATDAEVSMTLPGDSLIPPHGIASTRAVTINAPASIVWQWMIQLGQGRGGFYSHEWLENLFAAHMENADAILPELQDLKAGDRILYTYGGDANTVTSVVVTMLEPEKYFVLGDGWTFYLAPITINTTRLIVRYPWDSAKDSALYYYPILEPAHFVMESGMMLGIKQRAERSAAELDCVTPEATEGADTCDI